MRFLFTTRYGSESYKMWSGKGGGKAKKRLESATFSAPSANDDDDDEKEGDAGFDCTLEQSIHQKAGASTVASLRADVNKLKKQVKQLRQQLRCERNSSSQLVSNLKQFLTPDQIRYLKIGRKSLRTARWSNSTIKKCAVALCYWKERLLAPPTSWLSSSSLPNAV